MNNQQLTDFQSLTRIRLIEADPLADLSISCLVKIINSPSIPKEQKLQMIIEMNFSFPIVHHSLLKSKNIGQLEDAEYSFLLLHMLNWYKVNSMVY